MPEVAVNVIKVVFVAALYAFLFYVARSMRGHVAGPPVSTEPNPPPVSPLRPQPIEYAPPPVPQVGAIVVFDAEGRPTRHPIRGTVVLGRGDSADIRLDDEYASERHASFTSSDNIVDVEDLGSTNGTTIDGRRIEARIELMSGTAVIVGRTKVLVE